MTASTDRAERPFGDAWRAERARVQELCLPEGEVTVGCSAAPGSGGLGRHLQEILEALRRGGRESRCLCGPGSGSAEGCEPLAPGIAARAAGRLVRRSPSWRIWAASAAFDAAAAARLEGTGHVIAFSGQGRAQLRRAAELGFQSRGLVAPTSHLAGVDERFREAVSRYRIEGSWTPRLMRRSLEEYESAERIYVATRYVFESFAERGVPQERLALMPLLPAERFTPAGSSNDSPLFEILYIGSLSVVKGVALLIEAFSRQAGDELRLVLLGGWESRGMRRHIERARAADPRIEVRAGDPLEHLRRARLYVHPSYEDGFSYSCAEALACGVPVILSENTGAKELLEPGRSGLIGPTGDLEWLTEALAAAHRGELFNG